MARRTTKKSAAKEQEELKAEELKKLKKTHLFFGIPAYGSLAPQFFISFLKLHELFGRHSIPFNIGLTINDSLISRARSAITAMFLENKKATHLMFIDTDIQFEPYDVVRLILHDKDIVAAAYPKKTIDWEAVKEAAKAGEKDLAKTGIDFAVNVKVYPRNNKLALYTEGKLIEAREVGCGFTLIKREVIEKMIASYPQLQYKNTNPAHDPELAPYYYNIFDPMIDPEDRSYLSEDHAFCRHWQELGGKIWLDPTIKLGHVGTYTFTGEFFKSYVK